MDKNSAWVKIFIIIMNLLFIGGLVWLFAFIIPNRYREEDSRRSDLNEYGKYTIGNTLRSKYVQSGHAQRQIIDYSFTVNGVLQNSFFYPEMMYTIPKRYFVKFSEKDLSNNRILPIVVPDSIQSVSANGWSRIPGTLYTIATIVEVKNKHVSLLFHYKTQEYHASVFNDSISKSDKGKACYISFYPSLPEDDVVIHNAGILNPAKGTTAPDEGWTKEPWIK
jgi:hypothetical protein